MSNVTRRSFLKAPMATPDRLALAGDAPAAATKPALNRRTFLQSSAGAAAGVAVVAAGPKLAAAALSGGTNTAPAAVKPSGPAPREPVMAYVRDAARGEVTVLSGTRETTYRDPVPRQAADRRGSLKRPEQRIRRTECPRIAKRPKSARTRSPTTPTPTRSSAPTSRTPSRSSPTTSRCRRPAGGPNFFEFGDDVLYSIYIDNDGDALPEITYQFNFKTQLGNPNTFLYNTGPIASLDDPNWNKRQFYTVTRIQGDDVKVLGEGLACPPCNVGPRSTPNYAALGAAAVHTLSSGEVVFAGQRNDPFYVDLGLDLRPRRPAPVPEPAPDPDRRRPRASTRRRRSTSTRSRSRFRSAR